MRKCTIFLMLLCMHCIARGQTGFNYRYWFDNDYNTVYTGYSAADEWQVEADLSGLDESLHAIHIQVVDEKGVESAPVTRFFLKARYNSAVHGYYWFDNDHTVRPLSGQGQGIFSIDVSKLPEGFHTFYYQVEDNDGALSSVVSRMFFKVVVPESARYRCWVDDDFSTMTVGKYVGEPVLVDISQISEGYHIMRAQIEGATPSAVSSRPFVKIPQTEGVEYLKCLSIVDGQLYRIEDVPSTGGIIDWEFDVSSLPQGFHQMQVQVVTPSGAATSTYDAFFLRTTTNDELADMKCVYSIDGNEFNTEAGRMSNGVFHCDLDVAHLNDGLHRISYMLTNGEGVETKIQTQFFVKIPVGGNGITQYWYWLNDNEADKTVVKLEERINPYQLIGLLPVESVPIRSSLFHFEVDEEKGPMLYAKNEFHVRFYDASGRLVDATKEYLDYNVSEKVTSTEEIKRTQTFARPTENGIKWFTLQACEGDTIAFRSSQALSLQVFSPSGKELYATSGAESVKWGGCHTWEDGTHYVAVHDVTGSRTNVTLDYMHMDKYDVVDQDVRVVGNGGCSTITFYGNGFSDLYAVDLVSANGDTIHCGYIDHISDATVETIFDFYGVDLGKYYGVFYFTEENRKVDNIVQVEEAEDILLKSKVSYPNQYLRNTTVTYTLKVENQGNMTAYRVPLYVYISSSTEEGLEKIDIDGLNLPKLLDGLDRDSIPGEWLEYEERIGDGHYFITTEGYDDDLKDSVTIRSAYFFVDIAPQSTKSISLTLHANEYVSVWFTLPKDVAAMSAQDIIPQNAPSRASRASVKEHYCCIRERVECVGGLIGDAVGFANTIGGLTGIPHAKALAIADCAVGTLNTVISAAGEIACGENNVEESFYEKLKRLKDGISISGTIVGCFEKFLKGSQLLKIGDLSSFIGTATHATTWADCATAFSEKKPNCPPNPGGGGGGSQPVNSFDPNEIYGYLSPSGSKFIAKDSIEAVDYRIEFENDTAFATSSAHVVEIRDTLDARFFELATFAPTYISIGEKREQLDGTPNFVRTVDMRPQINTVVQVEGQYDEQTGIARWLFTSLDPMTMEPTDDVMQGFLPVNHDGTSGIGDVAYRIGLKKGLDDGTVITNRASIVFDSNEPILTPTWTNILDGSAPTSAFISVEELNDTVIRLKWKGNDGESPAWRYSLAVQAVEDTEWFEFLTNTTDTVLDYRYYRDIDYGFCVLATDSAGNVESTEWTRKAEFMREYIAGDADKSGAVNLLDLNLTLSYILGNEVSGCDMLQMDANGDGGINVLDINAILQIILNADGEAATLRKRDNGVIRIINTKVL